MQYIKVLLSTYTHILCPNFIQIQFSHCYVKTSSTIHTHCSILLAKRTDFLSILQPFLLPLSLSYSSSFHLSGELPYKDIPLATIVARIVSGYRLPKPEHIPDQVWVNMWLYDIMQLCRPCDNVNMLKSMTLCGWLMHHLGLPKWVQ